MNSATAIDVPGPYQAQEVGLVALGIASGTTTYSECALRFQPLKTGYGSKIGRAHV